MSSPLKPENSPQNPANLPLAPDRPIAAHKGTFGTVIVIGGSAGMFGAPALCASAALRVGAGLVKLACPQSVLPWAISIEPSATGFVLEEDPREAVALLDSVDPTHHAVLAIGPGMGQSQARAQLVWSLLHGSRTIVLDADGLNLLANIGRPRPIPGPPIIMTPHPGEFRRLAAALNLTADPVSASSRSDAARLLAREHQAVIVLKGHQSVVTDGTSLYLNDTGNPALSTAGSGDVLTGAIAGLLAQGMAPLDATKLGVHLHGKAADLWAQEYGPSGLTARDLANRLPHALHRYRQASTAQR